MGLRERQAIETIAQSQGMPLMQVDSEITLQEMSDQVLEAVFDRKWRVAWGTRGVEVLLSVGYKDMLLSVGVPGYVAVCGGY